MAAKLAITIIGRTYEISCDEGQQEYVSKLAAEVDRRADALLKMVGQVGDARLLVMVALTMADELTDLRRKVDGRGSVDLGPVDDSLASGIESLAERIDAIADRLASA